MKRLQLLFGLMPAVASGLAAAAGEVPAGPVIKRVLQPAAIVGENLLQADGWRAWQEGFARQGEFIYCDNQEDAGAQRGASQTVILNQTTPLPITASVWSKAVGVDGSPDADYSLYLDLEYTDGTPLWGQVFAFPTGTHDWQRGHVVVLPDKPVRAVSVHLLLRRHAGAAWFRDPILSERRVDEGAALFQGLAVTAVQPGYNGLQIRDVAAGSDYVAAGDGQTALGVRIKFRESPTAASPYPATMHQLVLEDSTGRDRALAVVYSLPLDNGPWRWLASPLHRIETSPPSEYQSVVHTGGGAPAQSRYPFGAVAGNGAGQAIGLNMHHPAVFRVGYSAGLHELWIAFDLGLTPEHPSATVGFCTFAFDPAWGFRAAAQRYHELFPDFFTSRIKQQGLWMPFHRISAVERWQDFGFRFKEGDNEVAWDDAHDMLTFRYTEPMTWWMRMDAPLAERTLDACIAHARRLADASDRHAQAFFTSGFHDAEGRLTARMLDTPWCNGAVWSINCAPGIQGEVTDFQLKWNERLRTRLYGPDAAGVLDGEYVDSSEGYVTAPLDYRRDHFAAMDTPLTYDLLTGRPAIFKGLIAYEYVRALARDVHGMDRLMMANGTPAQLCWLAPWLDVMGTETDWNPNGQWRPMTIEELLYRRVLCGPKPYCFLMNTDFDRFSYELVDKYMQRTLAFGMFPGFFSPDASSGHYFSRPTLYNRDRPLFLKYVPLAKRVAEAGWHPIPGARAGDPRIALERFGDRYLTVFNTAAEPLPAEVTLVTLPRPIRCVERVSGTPIAWQGEPPQTTLQLDGESVAVLDLQPDETASLGEILLLDAKVTN